MVVFHSILASVMGFHYLIFEGRTVENRKKLMLVQIMNSAGTNKENIVLVFSMIVLSYELYLQ